MRIATIRQTCASAPSQWEGRLADGRPFYIRYRWGRLLVSIGVENAPLDSAVDAPEWFSRPIGETSSGLITIEEVLSATGLTVA